MPLNKALYFSSVHPGHCPCLRRFTKIKTKDDICFNESAWTTLCLHPAVQTILKKKTYMFRKSTLDIVLASGGSNIRKRQQLFLQFI